MGSAILLTGAPGCGKTTAIRRVVASLTVNPRAVSLRMVPAGGFYTQEVRDHGIRKGFEIITLDGERGVLAHVNVHGRYRVGKYGVDVAALEEVGVAAIQRAIRAGGVVVIDEIGPMEILSAGFRQAVIQALDSDTAVLGTIVKRSTPFTDQIKARPHVRLIEVRPDNREVLVEQILNSLMNP